MDRLREYKTTGAVPAEDDGDNLAGSAGEQHLDDSEDKDDGVNYVFRWAED